MVMRHTHKELALGRWQTMTLAEQLGNIGSEYERAIRWKGKSDEHFLPAAHRTLELIDLTISDIRLKYRLKEITRMREMVCEEFFSSFQTAQDKPQLQNYFTQFALRARLGI
jgi:hypothetical protein